MTTHPSPMPSGYAATWLVAQARKLAQTAHAGQKDKAGFDYFDAHVADVAYRLRGWSPLVQCVAYLHDVVEDTRDRPEPRRVTLEDLRQVFPGEVVDAVDAITHREHEPRDDYYARVRANQAALDVKLHGDIPSNTDPERLALLPLEECGRLARKYEHAVAELTTVPA